ncbi:MAG: glutamate 5-kinase [Candidatus Omnitrophica bacterium]|nr:glutamate 5-kinase [Candidatus Omnitrophota bacterium]
MRKKHIGSPKKIVIKIGTSLLISGDYALNRRFLKQMVEEVSRLRKKGKEVILVSSGAIGLGMSVLGYRKRPTLLPELQACAAIGQGKLVDAYELYFSKQQFHTAQVLLTRDDLMHRTRYLNARNTLYALLRCGVIPIINENDTVAVEEIKFGDNDTLSALVAGLVEADLLIILSDIEGFFVRDCQGRECLQTYVEEISRELCGHARGATSETSVGGMITKLEAIKMATASGTHAVIASGRRGRVIEDIVEGKEVGTFFLKRVKRLDAKKRWLAFGLSSKGTITVDEGAKEVLMRQGRSLLASGITGTNGSFRAGDCVSLVDRQGEEFAKGLSNYSSTEVLKIKGLKSSQIESVLGQNYFDEVIHRNNLVLL